MRRGLSLILATIVVLLSFSGVGLAQEFELESEAALLMEPVTGEIIFAHNAEEKLYPASITKIMTLLLTMEAIDSGKVTLDDVVTVGPEAAALGGSTMFLSPGDQVRLEDLIIGVAVGSGNDAAVAIAEYLAGTEAQFVEQMNAKARALGMHNTNFVNAHGLHDDNHYTTALDISKMSRALLQYPKIHEWMVIWADEHFLQGQIAAGEVYLSNTNRLVRYYQGADGLKTGFTDQAGHCLVATAKRENARFLAIVLNAPSSDIRYQETRQLLDYAFANYSVVPLAEKGQSLGTAAVERGADTVVGIKVAEPLVILVKKGDSIEFEQEVRIQEPLFAPLAAGDKVGELVAMDGEQEVARVDIIADAPVAAATFKDYFRRLLYDWVKFGK